MGAGVVRQHLHTHVCLQLRRLKGNFTFINSSYKPHESFGGDFSSLAERMVSTAGSTRNIGLNFSMEI